MQSIDYNSSKWRFWNNPYFLLWYYITINLVPSIYFTFSEPVNIWGSIVIFIFPLSIYLGIFSISKNSGMWQTLLFPIIFLNSFQIVLFYLFGHEVIAADMFLNVATTNASEINELLSSLLPSIALVIALYLPAIFLSARQWRKSITLPWNYRKKLLIPTAFLLVTSLGLSFLSYNIYTFEFSFKQDVYPINAIDNLGFAVNKWDKVRRYPYTSENFTFEVEQDTVTHNQRRVFVLIIGETSRADSWQLYGYDKKTNPLLSNREDIVIIPDVLTQSNTTHKSVSLILSDVNADNYELIYNRKGIITAFKEAGFTTVSLSNQAENNSFIEYFTKEADYYKTIRVTNKATRLTENNFDEQLIVEMQNYITTISGDLFILLHTYGSHFNYKERYPSEFSRFKPDQLTEVSVNQKKQLVNSYDNSILYTDYFLNNTIDSLSKGPDQVALLYISDHGEDLFDDDRHRFLHASPTPTYYQLRIPMLMYFSPSFIEQYPEKIAALNINNNKAISSNTVFHTLLDAASIKSIYLKKDLSLVNKNFNSQPRLYLNDHDQAIPYLKMNLKKQDREMFNKNNIQK